jgi:cytochrome c
MLVTAIITMSVAGVAWSQGPMPEVARKAACISCHKIAGKRTGPAFAWVAYKYKDDKEAGRKAIIDQIINGSEGKWTEYTGKVIMPSYGATTTEEEREQLADFIMGLEPIAPPEP